MAVENGYVRRSTLMWAVGLCMTVLIAVFGFFLNTNSNIHQDIDGRLDTVEERVAPGVGWRASEHYGYAEKHDDEKHEPLEKSIIEIKSALKAIGERVGANVEFSE